MGADTSTLQSIDSLSLSLFEIEKKLTSIEAVHLHHERTISHDNKTYISGKLIECRSGITLIVGPVIGLIGLTTVRLLIETNHSSELSFNFFSVDELSTESRFIREEKLFAVANQPIAKTFSGLSPNTRYAVYIGGIEYTETLMNYAIFTTLPIDPKVPLRVLFTHHGLINTTKPGEVNLWQNLEEKVNLPEVVNLVIHNGDAVSIDTVIQAKVLELMDVITNEDSSSESWVGILNTIESDIRNRYRGTLSHPLLRQVLRRCGNVFIASQQEAAAITSSLLTSTILQTLPKDKKIPSKPEVSNKSVNITKTSEKVTAEVVLKIRGEDIEEPTDYSIEDDEVPAVGGILRRVREVTVRDVNYRSEYLDELRVAIIGAILRAARRSNWAYMRQLWDENYSMVSDDDIENENYLRSILSIRRKIQVLKLLHSHLDRTRLKLLREFGEEYNAADRMIARCRSVAADITLQERELLGLVEACSSFHETMKEPTNGFCIKLGRLLIVGVETCWGLLNKTGQVSVLVKRETPIHPEIFSVLEVQTDQSQSALEIENENTNIQLELQQPIDTIIFACSTQVLPLHKKWIEQPLQDVYSPLPFLIPHVDAKIILRLLSRWQQRNGNRSVILALPSSECSAEGYISPIIDPKGDDEGWDETRCKLTTLLLSEMDRKSPMEASVRHMYESCPIPLDNSSVVNTDIGFYGKFDNNKISLRRSYWEAVILPPVPPQQSVTSSTGWIAEVPASVVSHCITDCNRYSMGITLGPVIGKVTTHSATILVEVSDNGHMELICVDQITGVQYSSTQMLTAGIPFAFTFENLRPNRAYDVITSPIYPTFKHTSSLYSQNSAYSSITSSNTTITQRTIDIIRRGQVRGSFTTHRRQYISTEEKLDKEIIDNIRNQTLQQANIKSSSVKHTTNKSNKAFAFRCVFLGSNQPSARHFIPNDEMGDDFNATNYTAERIFMLESMELLRNFGDINSVPWNGIDLVIHCGHNVDFMSCIDDVVGNIHRLEELQSSLSKYDRYSCTGNMLTVPRNNLTVIHSKSLEDEIARLNRRIEDKLRDCYRLHWGTSCVQSVLLAHGSHVFVSSPMLDLLQAFQASSLRQLSRDLSNPCVQMLLEVITRLHNEYQHPDTTQNMPEKHYFMNGHITTFILKPQIVFNQDNNNNNNGGTRDECLISEEYFASLGDVLNTTKGANDDMLAAAATTDESVQVLLLISPLPIISDDNIGTVGDPLYSSNQPSSTRKVQYTTREVLRLLDMLTQWIEQSESREVLIIAGGNAVGYETSISAEQLAGPSSAVTTLRQLCIGTLIGIKGEGQQLGSESVDWELYSTRHKFTFKSSNYVDYPHIGVATFIGDINDGMKIDLQVMCNSDIKGKLTSLSRIKKFGENSISFPISDNYSEAVIKTIAAVEAHLHAMKQDQDNKKKGAPLNANTNANVNAVNISHFISRACRENVKILKECHEALKSLEFLDLPLNNGVCLVETISLSCLLFLESVALSVRAGLSPPSSFCVRQVWKKCLLPYERLRNLEIKESDGDDNDNDIKTDVEDIDKVTSPAEVVSACLCSDGDYFIRFIRDCFEVQSLLEYFAMEIGLDDGWEQDFE